MRGLISLAFVFLAASANVLAADDARIADKRAVLNSMASATASSPAADDKGAAAMTPAQALQQQLGMAPPRDNMARPHDYESNLVSTVFGAQLFTGVFARSGSAQFNPDYLLNVGDRVQVRMWGAFTYDAVLVVDPQGNLFLPQIGPVKVLGTRNQDLQRLIETAGRRVFRSNVFTYASLAAAQPVRVFVGGDVNRPGLYSGTSMDSILHYLDQAGGIDLDRGSFLSVQVKRGDVVRATVNLYDFLLQGRIPLVQLSDGDVIFIAPRTNTVMVTGTVGNAKQFEFADSGIKITDLSRLAKPKAAATHVRVVRNTGTVRNTEYYALADAGNVVVGNGDGVEFTSDKKPGTITVRVEGEHLSAQEYILPYGAKFGDLIAKIEFSSRSEVESMQLYRLNVRDRQKAMLLTSLQTLESTMLTGRSGTSEEALLRKEEAALVLQWVERAKKIEPTGQVMVAAAESRNELPLENGDIIRIPARDGLVLVAGEVLFPNTVAFDRRLALGDYIRLSGGYTQNANTERIVIAHRDGSFNDASQQPELRAGDEVLVLPKVDVKQRQIWKELTQIIYQIAVSAKIAFAL